MAKRAKHRVQRAKHRQRPPSPRPRRTLSLVSLLGLIVGVIASVVGIYQFEYVFPKVSMVAPGLGASLDFQVKNDSYVDFLSVSVKCEIQSLVFSNGFNFSGNEIVGIRGLVTSVIESGTTK